MFYVTKCPQSLSANHRFVKIFRVGVCVGIGFRLELRLLILSPWEIEFLVQAQITLLKHVGGGGRVSVWSAILY